MAMRSSQQLKELLKIWEGFSQKVYLDSGDAPTIGIGHLLSRSELMSGKILINKVAVDYRCWLTEQQVYDLLDQDLLYPEDMINSFVDVDLAQNQFDALVSFIFNIGGKAFRESTLLKVLNKGRYDQVPTQMRRWIHDNGVVVQGLVARREKEIALWNTGRGIK